MLTSSLVNFSHFAPPLNTDQNRLDLSSKLELAADVIFLSGIDLGALFSYAQILGEGMLRGKNLKNCSFLYLSIANQKLHKLCKN